MFGFLSVLTFLLVVTVTLDLPLLLLTLGLRRVWPRQVCAALVGARFAGAVGYAIWRLEWNDVWRHGIPSVGYMVAVFVPYLSVFGALGFALGRAMTIKDRLDNFDR